MTDLPLRKISETSTTITLGWTPPPDQWGYVPTIDGNEKLTDGKRHIGVGEAANEVKIGKPSGETNPVSKHSYGVKALGVSAAGTYPAATPPVTTKVPARKLTLARGDITICTVYDSPGTETFGPDPDKHGVIRWADGGKGGTPKYAGGRTVMLLGHRAIQGRVGRMFDFHSIPIDQPYGWTPLYKEGGEPSGVAPLSIDYWGDSRGLCVVPECQGYYDGTYTYAILSQSEYEARRNQIIWIWLDVTWGRTDGSTPRTGALKAGLANESGPRVNLSNIATHYYGQHMVAAWMVTYWSQHSPDEMITEIAGPRFGKTPQEALADKPVYSMEWEREGTHSDVAVIPDWDGTVPVPGWLT